MFSYLSLSEAVEMIPSKPSTNAFWRWCRRGLKARNGNIVRMEHCRIGGKIYVTEDAIEQFFSSLAKADTEYFEQQEQMQVPVSQNDKLKDDRMSETERFLREEGVL